MLIIKAKKEPCSDSEDYLARFNNLRGFFAVEIIVEHVVRYERSILYPIGKFMIISVAFFFFVSAYGLANSFARKKDISMAS